MLKQTQHCLPTTPKIVGFYLLHPFAHPLHVFACSWELLRKVLKPAITFSRVQTDATLIVGTLLGVVASVCSYRLRTDRIEAMSRSFTKGKQVLKVANSRKCGRFCLFQKTENEERFPLKTTMLS